VLIACWSPKGGTGTSTFVAASASVIARERGAGRGVRVADFAGDQSALLGVTAPGAGVNDWLAAARAPDDAVTRIAVAVTDRLTLLPAGHADARDADAATGAQLAALLAAAPAITLADLGAARTPALRAIAAHADVTLAIVRTCYLSLAHLAHDPVVVSTDALVLLSERHRLLGRRDFERVSGRRVALTIPVRGTLGRLADTSVVAAPAVDLEPLRGVLTRVQRPRRGGRAA
jgi:hypothetical protein